MNSDSKSELEFGDFWTSAAAALQQQNRHCLWRVWFCESSCLSVSVLCVFAVSAPPVSVFRDPDAQVHTCTHIREAHAHKLLFCMWCPHFFFQTLTSSGYLLFCTHSRMHTYAGSSQMLLALLPLHQLLLPRQQVDSRSPPAAVCAGRGPLECLSPGQKPVCINTEICRVTEGNQVCWLLLIL